VWDSTDHGGGKRRRLPHGRQSISVPTPGRGAALVLSLDGKWLECTVARRRAWLSIEQEKLVASGMSGSPIVSMAGRAIGLLSTGGLNPVLVETLPPRIRVAGRQAA
jgi:hypothetical protein